MPLVGLIDENGKKLKWAKIRKGEGEFSDPLSVLLSLFTERKSYCDYSVTELLGDPYQLQLQRRTDYYESVDDFHDRTLGIAVHSYLEKADTSGIKCMKEQRYTWKVKVGGKWYEIGGTCDLIEKPTLWDYKTITCGKLSRMRQGQAKDSVLTYHQQPNMYRFLAIKNKIKGIKKLKLRFVVKDWRFYEFRRVAFDLEAYPKGFIMPVPVMKEAEVEKLIKSRLKLHISAERLGDTELHKAGECSTWGGLRCNHYCALGESCHFQLKRKETAKKKKAKKKVEKKKKVIKKVKRKLVKKTLKKTIVRKRKK